MTKSIQERIIINEQCSYRDLWNFPICDRRGPVICNEKDVYKRNHNWTINQRFGRKTAQSN